MTNKQTPTDINECEDPLKLFKESDVILKKEPDIIQARFEHGYPLNSHTKCKT